MKKTILFILFILAFITVLFFKYREPQTIKIGFIANLSGTNSHIGINGRSGVELAVKHINNSGGILGKQVELIIEDNKGISKESSRCTQELVNMGVKVIIGPYISSMASSVIQPAKTRDVLVISPTVSTNELKGIDDNFIRVVSVASVQGETLGNILVKNGHKSVVTIIDLKNKTYSESILQQLKKRIAQDSSIDLKIFTYTTDKEFKLIRTEMMQNMCSSRAADAVVFITNGQDAGTIIQQCGKKEKLPQLYGSMWTKSSSVNKYAGKQANGMIILDHHMSNTPSEKGILFIDTYKKSYYNDPTFISQFSYESVMLFKQAVESANCTEYKRVKREIIIMPYFEGVTGSYKFDKYGDVIRDQNLSQIVNGEFVTYNEK